MTANIRNLVVFFFLFMGLIPFLLMTDLFPFMRFGMFAETVKTIPQKELFSVCIQTTSGTCEPVSKRQIGLDDSHLNYLARIYYYQHQLPYFSSELRKSGLLHPEEHLIILRKVLTNDQWQNDTVWDQ